MGTVLSLVKRPYGLAATASIVSLALRSKPPPRATDTRVPSLAVLSATMRMGTLTFGTRHEKTRTSGAADGRPAMSGIVPVAREHTAVREHRQACGIARAR